MNYIQTQARSYIWVMHVHPMKQSTVFVYSIACDKSNCGFKLTLKTSIFDPTMGITTQSFFSCMRIYSRYKCILFVINMDPLLV